MDLSCRVIPPGALGHVLSRQVALLRLAQSEVQDPIIEENSKVDSLEFRARILYLDMSMTCISEKSLGRLFSKCYRLKKLSLEQVPISTEVLSALSQSHDLEVLNLAMCTGITLEGVKCLLTECQRLKQVNLAWTSLSGDSIDFICKNLPSSMDRLNLSGCRKVLTDKSKNILKCVHLFSYVSLIFSRYFRFSKKLSRVERT